MAGAATITELPPIKIPEVIKPSSVSLGAPPENPAAILGIIEEHPIPPGTPDGVLHMIAEADLSKKPGVTHETAPETAADGTKPPEKTEPATDEAKPTTQLPENKNTDNQQKKETEPSTPPPEEKPEEKKDEKKKEEKPQKPKNMTEEAKKDDKKPEEQKKTAEQPVTAELVRQTLQELGQELADIKNDNAKNVALALSMGDTPLAHEFQEQTARFILRDGRPEGFNESRWSNLEGRLPGETADNGLQEFNQFLKDENIPPEQADHINMARAIDSMLRQKDQKGRTYTEQALRLQRRLGWSEKNPMPTTAHELTKHLGGEGENSSGTRETNMQAMMKKDQVEKQRSLFFQKLKFAKGQMPSALYIMLIGTSFFTQMTQESGQQH